jgi:hypothetical protein
MEHYSGVRRVRPPGRHPRPGAHGGSALASAVASAVAALALVLAAGCSAAGNGAAPLSPLPATSGPGTGRAPNAIGQSADADHSFIAATVFAYRQPVASGAPAPNPGDYAWAAVDVQTCASASVIFNAAVTGLQWLLVYGDGTEVEPARTAYPQFPRPRYPIAQRTLRAGECVRGWIMFPVPAAAKPQLIRYAPFGSAPVDWVVVAAG